MDIYTPFEIETLSKISKLKEEITENNNEENDQISQLILLSCQLCIYTCKDKELIHDEYIVELFNNLPNPNNIQLSLYQSYKELKNNVKNSYKQSLTYIIRGFTFLKIFEYHLHKENFPVYEIYRYLSEAKENFEIAEEKNGIVQNINKYLLLWGKGLSYLFYSQIANDEKQAFIFSKKANQLMLKAYDLYTRLPNENGKIPIMNDPLFDVSPYYIGLSFHKLHDDKNCGLFVQLAQLENNIPIYMC